MDEQLNMKKESPKPKINELCKGLKWYEIVVACWPIILITIGGAIGGAFGGLACYQNIRIFNSKLSKPLKYTYSFLIGIGGIALFFMTILILAIVFPNMFVKR